MEPDDGCLCTETCGCVGFAAVKVVCRKITSLLLLIIQRQRGRQTLRLYYTILLPDNGQSNRPKHVVEI
jgi:hypothetical protein